MIRKVYSLIITVCLAITFSCSSTKPVTKKTVTVVKQRGPLSTYKMGPILTKTADKKKQKSIRIELYLAFIKVTPALQAELNARSTQMKDSVRALLHSKKTAEMASMTKILHLKDSIKKRLNNILINGKIVKIFFTEVTIK